MDGFVGRNGFVLSLESGGFVGGVGGETVGTTTVCTQSTRRRILWRTRRRTNEPCRRA